MSMDNDERILIGIINSRNYTTKNNQDCSNIDIGFEEFCSNDKNNTREYGVVNQVRFLDEEPKVFLTCEAAATRNKFGEGHLIRIKANPSPEDKGCRYTTYNKNISKVDVDDFIEIINPKIESWHAAERVAVLEHRPSTDYVMAECNKYVVSQEVFPFLSCDSVEFYSLEKAKKFLLEQFEREFGEVKKTPSIEFADDFKAVTRDLNEKFYNYILKKTKDRLNAFDLKSLAEKGNIGYLNTIIAESINSFAADNNLVRDTAEKIRNNILADGTMQEILQALIEADKAKEDTEGQKTAVTGENSASAVNPAEENLAKQADNENTGNAEVSAGSVASDVSQTSAVQSDNGGQSVSSEQEKQTGSFSSVEENADGIKVIRSTANDIIKMGARPFTIGDEEERSNRAMVLRAVASMSGGLGSSPDSDSFSSLSKAISKASSMDDGILEEEEEEELFGSFLKNNRINPVFDERLYAGIETKKVLMGPFVVSKCHDLQEPGTKGFECTLNIPDSRCSIYVKDELNSTVRVVDYSLLTEYIKEVSIDGIKRKYLVQMPHQRWNEGGKKLDLIDDKKLIDKYAMNLLSPTFKDLKINQLQKIRQNVRGTNLFRNEGERIQRMFHILQKVVDFEAERTKLFGVLAGYPEFDRFISDFINTHQESIVSKYRKDLLNDIKKQKDDLKKEFNELEQDIAKKRNELAKLQTKIKNNAGKVPEESAPAAAVTTEKKAKTVPAEEYEVLKSEYKKLQNEFKTMTDEVNSLKLTKSKIEKELQSEVSDLSSRYLDMHSMLKAFTSPKQVIGKGFSFESAPVDTGIKLDNISKSRNKFIEELRQSMKSYGRDISKHKLASMVVSIAQNQFTILAGLPGSGKTSFVKTMGKALNLRNRLHTIPVARGWTSQRDILGYWNSLTSSFQSAPTGLWELLTTLNNEKDPAAVSPAILLLDEMNLSAPEHYFSSFMQLADGESERKIFTGSPELPYLNIPEYLRFVGTVNSDETVNMMSARMLDRSAVILFDEMPSQADDYKNRRSTPVQTKNYSASQFLELFNVKDVTITNKMYRMLNSIEEIMYSDDEKFGQRIVISYRKHQQIIEYLSVVSQIFSNFNDCDAEVLAMDYAVKQFVLPMINGFGEGLGNRLENLAVILDNNGLNDSLKILQRMITDGSERMNSYQFFA